MYHKSLLRDEEIKSKFKNGNHEARNKVVMSYLPKVEHIVKSLWVDEKYEEDLIQAGMLGVLEALEKIRKNDKDNISARIHRGIIQSLVQYLIANKIVVDSQLEKTLTISSINRAFGNDTPLYNIESYTDTICVDTELDQTVESLALDSVEMEVWLSVLSNRELYVFIHVIGLYGCDPQTYEAIGQDLNLSKSSIGAIYQSARRKVRRFIIFLEKDEEAFNRFKKRGEAYTAVNHLTKKRK